MQSESETNIEARMGRKNLQTFSSILFFSFFFLLLIARKSPPSPAAAQLDNSCRKKEKKTQLVSSELVCVCLTDCLCRRQNWRKRRTEEVEARWKTSNGGATTSKNSGAQKHRTERCCEINAKKGPPFSPARPPKTPPKVTTRRRCNFSPT